MPLAKGSSRETISANIAELVRAGHDPKQAAAIAYREAGADGAPAGSYVRRNLTPESAAEFVRWASDQGFGNVTPAPEMHATIVYSRVPLDWMEASDETTARGGKRTIEPLGDKGAVVLKFESAALRERWQEAKDAGATWDWPTFHPHVTITYDADGKDISDVEPFRGDLVFGPEIHEPLNDNWAEEKGLRQAKDARAVVSFAVDRSARHYDADGRLHVALSHISKGNICGYYGREIPNSAALGLNADQLYMLWRHPDELRKGAETSNNIPLLDTHIIVSTSEPEQESVVGSTGTDAVFSDPYLDNSLVIWTDWAIQGVEKREVCELSCAYRYVADMQPGEHDGLHYDGIMRNIVFNHVALVPEGRAGPDVVVGDSQEIAPMPLTSRKALMTRGALAIALKQLMAADAKVDLDVVLAGVTSKNFDTKAIAARLNTATRGKLKDGASLTTVAAALDAMEEEACEDEEPDDEEAKKKEAADKRAKDKRGKDRARDRKASMDKMRARDGDPDEDDDERKGREATDAAEDMRRASDGEPEEGAEDWETRYEGDRKKARDAKGKDAKGKDAKGMDAKAVEKMIKTAVDAAVTRTRDVVVADMAAMDTARRDVAPYIGEVGEVESARDLYVMALDSAEGVKLDGTESLSALRNMVRLLPRPDAVPPPRIALDAAVNGGFAKRFPTAGRIGFA